MTTTQTYKFKTFADLLVKALHIKDLTQYEFAQMVDKDPAQVSKWISGTIKKPSTSTVFIISAALDVQIRSTKDGYELTIDADDGNEGLPADVSPPEEAKAAGIDITDDLTSKQIREKIRNHLQTRMQRLGEQISSYSQEMQEIKRMLDLLDLYED